MLGSSVVNTSNTIDNLGCGCGLRIGSSGERLHLLKTVISSTQQSMAVVIGSWPLQGGFHVPKSTTLSRGDTL